MVEFLYEIVFNSKGEVVIGVLCKYSLLNSYIILIDVFIVGEFVFVFIEFGII